MRLGFFFWDGGKAYLKAISFTVTEATVPAVYSRSFWSRNQEGRSGERGRDFYSVLLPGGSGQPADQRSPRPLRQDPRVQVLRGAGRGSQRRCGLGYGRGSPSTSLRYAQDQREAVCVGPVLSEPKGVARQGGVEAWGRLTSGRARASRHLPRAALLRYAFAFTTR